MSIQNQNNENFHVPTLHELAPKHQGWVLMIGGALLLAHTMGLLGRGITFFLAGLGVYMIIIGFFKARLHIPLQNVLHQMGHKK